MRPLNTIVGHIIFSIILISMIFANSRVAFSRPGSVYRTPGSFFPDLGEGKVSLGFSSEILDFEIPSNSSTTFINTKIKKWNFGLSYTLLPDYRSTNAIGLSPLEESPYELGMHFSRRVYGYKSLFIDIGMQDLSVKNTNSDKGLFDDASLYFVVSNNNQFDNYDMTINYGFGTGKLGSDYHNYDDDSGPSMSPFLSLFLNTPYLNNKMNFIFEYDGQGINVGTQFPITDIYSLRAGISHINKITEWGKRSEEGNENIALENDAPAIMFGFIMNIPDARSDMERIKNKMLDESMVEYGDIKPLVIIDSTKIEQQKKEILNYQDSIKIYKSRISMLDNESAHIRKNIIILEDSTKKMLLDIEIEKSKRNEAMRKFQKTHDLLVEKDYYAALDMINKVIELQPDLAIAYARRGTVYYYLNDTKSASMNWNIALKLDPEYDQVREILKGLKEGALEPIYKNKTEEE